MTLRHPIIADDIKVTAISKRGNRAKLPVRRRQEAGTPHKTPSMKILEMRHKLKVPSEPEDIFNFRRPYLF